MEGNQWGGRVWIMGEKVQGIRSINGRYKIDRGRVRTVEVMEKPKNLYVQPTHGRELSGGLQGGMGVLDGGSKGEKMDNCNSIINKIKF